MIDLSELLHGDNFGDTKNKTKKKILDYPKSTSDISELTHVCK